MDNGPYLTLKGFCQPGSPGQKVKVDLEQLNL